MAANRHVVRGDELFDGVLLRVGEVMNDVWGGIVVQLYNIFHNLHDRGVVVLHCAEMDVIMRRYSGALITHGN